MGKNTDLEVAKKTSKKDREIEEVESVPTPPVPFRAPQASNVVVHDAETHVYIGPSRGGTRIAVHDKHGNPALRGSVTIHDEQAPQPMRIAGGVYQRGAPNAGKSQVRVHEPGGHDTHEPFVGENNMKVQVHPATPESQASMPGETRVKVHQEIAVTEEEREALAAQAKNEMAAYEAGKKHR